MKKPCDVQRATCDEKTAKRVRIVPSAYGFDRNLMQACIIEAIRKGRGFTPQEQAGAAVMMYEHMYDKVTASGGEMEVPSRDLHRH